MTLTRDDIIKETDMYRLLGISIKLFDALEKIAKIHVEQRESIPATRLWDVKTIARQALEWKGTQ